MIWHPSRRDLERIWPQTRTTKGVRSKTKTAKGESNGTTPLFTLGDSSKKSGRLYRPVKSTTTNPQIAAILESGLPLSAYPEPPKKNSNRSAKQLTISPSGELFCLRPAPLSTNHIYKVSSRPYPHIYMTEEGKALKEDWQWQLRSQRNSPELLKGELEIYIIVYYEDRRKRDIDNGNKILWDSMSGVIYEDDSQITDCHIAKRYDKKDPRVEIEIITHKAPEGAK